MKTEDRKFIWGIILVIIAFIFIFDINSDTNLLSVMLTSIASIILIITGIIYIDQTIHTKHENKP